ncbi:sensor histidine kinase [Pilimelia anulata]|uniref:Sensor histidine kinase n=1 Tax=Pilimelia anulata TaxID=53371 RepID=A0A8J3FBA8_9ACTN|nr:GAF domain-containing sensor histidine kinase [Pilimelia anulata]GGK01018.1 sensor histidine kinase [Pilimelia anulata]
MAEPTRPPQPDNEEARLARLRSLDVLDTPPEEEFDQIVALAARVCGTPMSLVSLVDAERQWFKAKLGLDMQETSRDLSFCAYAILGRDLMVVPDLTRDARFAGNPAVTDEHGIRFYAGAPLVTSDGFPLGTLCVVDAQPRRLSVDQMRALRALARQVTAQLELRHAAGRISAVSHHQQEVDQRLDEVVHLVRAHLRGPLADVRAYLDLLAAGIAPDPDLTARAAGVVRANAGELRALVDTVLAVVGGDGAGLRLRMVDLTRLTARAVEAVRPIAGMKGIGILHPDGPELPILADPVRLEQALAHLLFAAVKFTPEHGRVRVTTEGEPAPGLRLDDLEAPGGAHPHLFEHLYRGAIATPAPGQPDAGLAVTKQILDVHHATLALTDRPGEGTSLHLVFPPHLLATPPPVAVAAPGSIA